MIKENYKNTIELQVKSLPSLAITQIESCFNEDVLQKLMTGEEFKKIKKVIITGCGDSYSAAGAMATLFKKYSGVDACDALDPMQYSRFCTKESVLEKKYNDNEILVIIISASGKADRIAELLSKTNTMGVKSMLVTNNIESRGAFLANSLFFVNTPPLCDSPGLRSYFASMIALAALGSYIGVLKGHINKNDFINLKKEILSYSSLIEEALEKIDDEMFALAKSWKGFNKFEIIGDDNEFFSAQFSEQTLIECTGAQAVHADSEDWCHINFFLRNPQEIPTIFKADKNAKSFDRIKESIRVAVSIGRPTLVIADADKASFDARAIVCSIPSVKEEYHEILPMFDYIPDALLAGYCAALSDKLFFGGRYDYRKQVFIPEITDGLATAPGSSDISIII